VISHVLVTPAIVDEPHARSLLELARAWSATYDLLLRTTVDPGRPISPDELRVADRGYQLELDEAITRALNVTAAVAMQLPIGDPERERAALAEIERVLNPM